MNVRKNIQISATLVRRIGVGEGRNSEEFLAFDTQLNGHVALKQVPVSSLGIPLSTQRGHFTPISTKILPSCAHATTRLRA